MSTPTDTGPSPDTGPNPPSDRAPDQDAAPAGHRALAASLHEMPLVGMMRGCPPAVSADVATAAIGAGLRCVEITLDSPEWRTQIAAAAEHHANRADVQIGAGTVTTRRDVEDALGAGAAFIVTPVVSPEVIAACVETEVPCLIGAATPTEIWRAHDLGAFAVKVYPIDALGGPTYVRTLRAPLRHIPLVPTGAVDAGNAADHLAAGALALGVGSSIFADEAYRAADPAAAIRTRTTALVDAVRGPMS